MIDLSLPGLLGAIVGTVAAALAYGPIVTALERRMRARDPARAGADRSGFENEMSLLRRTVLAIDIAVLGGIGYWLGRLIAD
jgi:hypothetical protein